ncbi:Creatinase/aminopeptidase [Schizophyllum commune H4-8]|uniref:Aminopeptidase P N-terminal domain-containing protein n=1 Tax=Schizophyllum commune (strain H4-8 / FGSC 9210) TaxID=578458 RepID=D8Q6X4_SCHCM|nr:Creatinase/aminopeptidase [Schizophyllum commune H4-8]KAI5891732.1 Creatinase/aminopeptidase [Schizophyllum commune H4-8]
MVYPAQKHVLKVFGEIVKALPPSEQAKPQVLLLAGEVTPYRNDTDREMHFRQESNFYYVTGCNVPSAHLLSTFQLGTSFETMPTVDLFIPPTEPADIMWSIPPPTAEAAKQTHDVTKVDYTSTLPDAIATLLKAFPEALFHTLPRASPLFPFLREEYADMIMKSDGAITDAYLLPALHRARLVKDEEEVALIRKANAISSRAHEVVMRVLGKAVKGLVERGAGAGTDRPLLPGDWLIEKEAEAEAIFVASTRREGAIHQAYLPIVAASNRASTLHYCCNDREFAWGPVDPHDHSNKQAFAQGQDQSLLPQVLLIDAGCEWSNYAADITRTMPVGNGGKFSPEAREIYKLVHQMQKDAFAILEPGVHWDKVHALTHRVLVNGFIKLGIFKCPADKQLSNDDLEAVVFNLGLSWPFYPHGLGHSLGMDVHDVPSASKPAVNDSLLQLTPEETGPKALFEYLRLRLPLEEGMVVTVEPGCYFHPHLLAPIYEKRSEYIDYDVLKKYEGMGGVRIEDCVLITKNGYENLTTVKSDVEWVEGVCSGEL